MKLLRSVIWGWLAVVASAGSAVAGSVELSDAREFARAWRGKGIRGARTVKSAAGESRFHIVQFESGGWAAVGADDAEAPVIAFSDTGEDLVEDERNPVWFLVKRDTERRAKARGSRGPRGRHKGWARQKVREAQEVQGVGSVKTATVKTGAPTTALDNVRVAPLVQSTWGQSTAGGYNVYNYYTPANYVCGCVATMTAQLMRYFKWPQTSVAAATFPCFVGKSIPDEITEDQITSYTMKGGEYEWSKMTLSPNWSTPDANRQAIGKLCYDIGVSVCMMWSAGGSGAYLTNAREALVGTWGYANAHCVAFHDNVHAYDFNELKTIVISNCEAGLPVGYGISGASAGGHAVVIDGYGYSADGEFYMHINPGWSGDSNAWYNPPNLRMGNYAFDSSEELVYNIFTEGSGQLVTGKVVDQHGEPVQDARIGGYLVWKEEIQVPVYGGWSQTRVVVHTNEVSEVTTDKNGKYHLKTGLTGKAATLYATATLERVKSERTENLPAAQTMTGTRTSPYAFKGSYSTNGYSLGNKYDVDFTLKLTRDAPKVLFR